MIPARDNIYPRFPGGKTKVFTTSFDDGVEQDIRLVTLMKEHKIRGTFNLNTGLFRKEGQPYSHPLIRRITQREIEDLFKDSEMEIAVHGVLHPDWTKVPAETALWDILLDRKNLETMFGQPIRGAAYPYGGYNEKVIDLLRAAGICYSRTVEDSWNFALPSNWLALAPTCHFAAKNLPDLTEQFLKKEKGPSLAMFYLWGHSYEFESLNCWNVIEDLFDQIAGKDDIWYATNIEIYDYMKAYESLSFSLECDYVYNPSAISVWIEKKGSITEIPPGKTVKLP